MRVPMGQGLSGVRDKLPVALGGRGGGSGSGGTEPVPGTSDGAAGKDAANEQHYTVEEALALLHALKQAYAEESFQKLLRRAEALHPRRGQRGHPDQQAFTAQLQGLLLHVYRTVLPRKPWCLEPGWEGYRMMMALMAPISEDPLILKAHEEINAILGLPRQTVLRLRPPTDEPVFIATPDGSGAIHMYAAPLLTDGDGDVAHEFWEEDRGGELRCVLSSITATATDSAGQRGSA